ncbi:MAG: hypothetical protein AVDCRST_MAG16-1098, partial [uncultured Frankineae bacterium]
EGQPRLRPGLHGGLDQRRRQPRRQGRHLHGGRGVPPPVRRRDRRGLHGPRPRAHHAGRRPRHPADHERAAAAGHARVRGDAGHGRDLRRLPARSRHQRQAQRVVRLLLRAALPPHLVLRARVARRAVPPRRLHGRAADRPAGLGAGVLEGGGGGPVAVRCRRSRHRHPRALGRGPARGGAAHDGGHGGPGATRAAGRAHDRGAADS